MMSCRRPHISLTDPKPQDPCVQPPHSAHAADTGRVRHVTPRAVSADTRALMVPSCRAQIVLIVGQVALYFFPEWALARFYVDLAYRYTVNSAFSNVLCSCCSWPPCRCRPPALLPCHRRPWSIMLLLDSRPCAPPSGLFHQVGRCPLHVVCSGFSLLRSTSSRVAAFIVPHAT